MKFTLNYPKYFLKSLIPISIWNGLAQPIQGIREKVYSEHINYNPNATIDNEIYVIRRRPPGGGLFSNVNHVMQGIEYSIKHKLIPVVDMQNYWTSYSQRRKFHGSSNAWEYFFCPVSNVDLGNLETFSRVRYSKGDRINSSSGLADRSLSFVLDPNLVDFYGSMYQNHLRMNSNTLKIIDNVKEFIGWNPETVGVSYRGADYLELKAGGHARQPEITELSKNLMGKVLKLPSAKVLISTDDNRAREIITSSVKVRAYVNFRDETLLKRFVSNKSNPSPQVLNALGYLIEVVLLSEGKTIVCSIANGSATAILLNRNKYEDPLIINKGTY